MSASTMLAMLLAAGVCGRSDFHNSAGGTLSVIVCPVSEMPAAPAAPPPAEAPVDPRHQT